MYNSFTGWDTESIIPKLIYEKERNDYEVAKILYDFAVSHIHFRTPHFTHRPRRHKA